MAGNKITLKSIMAGIDYVTNPSPPKLVARATVEYYDRDGNRVIRLYNTDILVFKPETKFRPEQIEINYGSWPTNTIQNRINKFLGGGFYVSFSHDKDRGEALIYPRIAINTHEQNMMLAQLFESGLIISDGMLPETENNNPHKSKMVDRMINRFVNFVDKALDFRCPKVGGTVLINGKYTFDQLNENGHRHRWAYGQNTREELIQASGYNHGFVSAILTDAIENDNKMVAKLVADKLDSDIARAGLRKAVREYLRNMLGSLY